MRAFTYERAPDAQAAVAAASMPGAKYISGGTNLLDLMKLEIEQPTHLVDIGRLPLKDIDELADGGLRIGATSGIPGQAAQPSAVSTGSTPSSARATPASPRTLRTWPWR